MKNLKRISVLVLALMLCLSTVSFAFTTDDAAKKQTIKCVLSTDTFEVGKPVTLDIYLFHTENSGSIDFTGSTSSTITLNGVMFPICLGQPAFSSTLAGVEGTNVKYDNTKYASKGIATYSVTAVLNDDVTTTATTPAITLTFNPTEKGSYDTTTFQIAKSKVGYKDGVTAVAGKAANKTVVIEIAPSGPKFDASGKATSGTVAGHDIVGGGKTEDRTYFADQFTLTGTTAETTILGIKTTFVPVYADGADESKAVVKEYAINAEEGIAGGAELKFNVVLIGTPATVTGVNISSEIITK